MSQYHPDADPDFVAMHSHYQQLWNSHFSQSLFNAFYAISLIATETEMEDFYYELWHSGYKIVPVSQTERPTATSDEPPTYTVTKFSCVDGGKCHHNCTDSSR